jgi:hypothetical protein
VVNARIEAALAYADRDWHVIPLRPGTKIPAAPNHPASECDHTDPRCYPTHTGWEARATTNPDRIIKAWSTRPWGIGIACGPSRLVVVDLDIAKNGQPSGAATLARLEAEAGEALPPTWTVATPSGGRHLYYQTSDDVTLTNTAGHVGPGIDTRAVGGQVVAPPTTLPTGPYTVNATSDVAPLPPWFSNLLTAEQPGGGAEPGGRTTHHPRTDQAGSRLDDWRVAAYVDGAIQAEVARLLTLNGPGSRNRTLFIVAANLGELIAAGVADETDVVHALESTLPHLIGLSTPKHRFTWAEGTRTIRSGLARGRRRPRQLPPHLLNRPSSIQRKAS